MPVFVSNRDLSLRKYILLFQTKRTKKIQWKSVSFNQSEMNILAFDWLQLTVSFWVAEEVDNYKHNLKRNFNLLHA